MKTKKSNKSKTKVLPWTSDLQEIERRMIAVGLIKNSLIWDKKNLK